MKRKVVVSALVAAACVAGSAMAADTVTSVNVVGYFQIPIASNRLNLIAVPMSKLPVYRGVISASDGTTITDSGANWTVNQFLSGGTNLETVNPGVKSHFYIEISDTNNAFQGRYMDITNNTATTLTIVGGVDGDIVSPALNGAFYKIIAHNRAIDVFGGAGMKASISAGSADNLLFWNGTTWESATYLYLTNGANPNLKGHLVQNGVNADDKVVRPDAGVFLKNISSNYTITVAGEVSANEQKIVLEQGMNLLGGQSVVDLQIGNAGLKDVMKSSISAGTADNLLFWNGTTWESAIYLYPTNGANPNLKGHFVQNGENVDSIKVVRASSGYFLKILTNAPPTWIRTSPLQ